MKFFILKHHKKSILLLFFVLIACFHCFAQQSHKSLSDRDKTEIIRFILDGYDLLNRTLSMGEEKDIVPLSLQNISPKLVPKLQGITFDLLTAQKIEEKTQTGFNYYSFGKFQLKDSKVQVEFGDTFLNSKGGATYSFFTLYEFRKTKGKWKGNAAGFSKSMS